MLLECLLVIYGLILVCIVRNYIISKLYDYVVLHAGCVNQNPAGELKQLDKIIGATDCIFTPVSGKAEIPDIVSNYYTDYVLEAWNGEEDGYLSRCWCRVEMFYAANVPLFPGSQNRINHFSAGFKFHAMNGVRPHLLYGSHELENDMNPIVLPPLQNSYFKQFDPMKGYITYEEDKLKIETLVAQLLPYMKTVDIGYVGDMDEAG